jgi:hypothetical protein
MTSSTPNIRTFLRDHLSILCCLVTLHLPRIRLSSPYRCLTRIIWSCGLRQRSLRSAGAELQPMFEIRTAMMVRKVIIDSDGLSDFLKLTTMQRRVQRWVYRHCHRVNECNDLLTNTAHPWSPLGALTHMQASQLINAPEDYLRIY